MKRARSIRAWLISAALISSLAAAGVAWAHPSLVRSEPPANSTLDASPGQAVVWLDEAIEPDYAHLSVYDSAGQRVDRLDARYMPVVGREAAAAIVVSLPPLPRGSYVVVWRVLSVGDGHAVGGAFAFGVGVPPDTAAAASAAAEANTEPDLTTHLIRFLGLLSQTVLLGMVAFRGLVWAPGLRAAEARGLELDRAALDAQARRFLTVAADVLVGALIIGALGALYVQARASGVAFWELFGTRWGLIWIARAALALVAGALMERILDGRGPAWLGWGLALGLIVATTLTSHSSARPGLVGPLADLAHQAAAALWLGGLLMLAIGLFSLRRAAPDPAARGALAAEWLARYSALAALSVGVLLASGAVLAAQQAGGWSGLLLTRYGQSLLIKGGLVACALAFAAYNSLRSVGRARAGGVGRSAYWVAGEAFVVLAVLLLAARLADLPPGASVAAADESPAPPALAFSAQAGELSLAGRVTPARAGANVFAVAVTGPDGLAVEGAAVRLTFQAVGSALASQVEAAETGVGVYMASSPGLAREGPWQVLVRVERPGAATPDFAAVDLNVGPDGVVRLATDPLPWTVRAAGWLTEHGRGPLALAALVLVVGWSWFAGRALPPRLRPGGLVAGVLLAALIIVIALTYA